MRKGVRRWQAKQRVIFGGVGIWGRIFYTSLYHAHYSLSHNVSVSREAYPSISSAYSIGCSGWSGHCYFFYFYPEYELFPKKTLKGGGSSYAYDHHHYIIIFIIIADFLIEHNCANCRKGYVWDWITAQRASNTDRNWGGNIQTDLRHVDEPMARELHASPGHRLEVWYHSPRPVEGRGHPSPEGERGSHGMHQDITLLSIPDSACFITLLLRHQWPKQSGCTPGKGTVDRIPALRVIVKRHREFGHGLFAVYIDLKKVFHSVHPDSLW